MDSCPDTDIDPRFTINAANKGPQNHSVVNCGRSG